MTAERHKENFSRSLYACTNLRAGSILDYDDVELFRPSIGIDGACKSNNWEENNKNKKKVNRFIGKNWND